MNRRLFIKTLSITSSINLFASTYQHAKENDATLMRLLHDLFPKKEAAYPSVAQLHSVEFIRNTQQEMHLSQSNRLYTYKGIAWLNESAMQRYKLPYRFLSFTKRELILQEISAQYWGDEWLSTIMAFYFETMMSDPIYDVNTDKSGWNWLGYTPGYPRPTKRLV